jgi:anti-sigma regulatory factor (Ser/Thr protein kinase)
MTGSDDSLTDCAPQRHEQKFEARRDQVREARRFLAGLLDGCPSADDVLLVAPELVTNSVLHSASSEPGGTFTITAEIREGDHVRIEACDDGGHWNQRDHRDGRPHGLDIIATLAAKHGVSGDSSTGWTAWAVLPWHPAPSPEPPSPNGHLDDDHR